MEWSNFHCRMEMAIYEALRAKTFTERISQQQIVNDALRAYLANYLVTDASK